MMEVLLPWGYTGLPLQDLLIPGTFKFTIFLPFLGEDRPYHVRRKSFLMSFAPLSVLDNKSAASTCVADYNYSHDTTESDVTGDGRGQSPE